MKQLLVGILFLIICVLSFQDLMHYVLFKINQDEIAENFCVNINTPAVMCYGKCQLTEVVSKSKNTDSSDVPFSSPDTERISFVYTFSKQNFTLNPPSDKQAEPIRLNENLLPFFYFFDVFRPPAA